MKRVVVLAVLACVTGCSNAPIAGFLDCFFPSKASGPKPPDGRTPLPPGDRIPPPADLGPPTGAGPIVPKIGG
ncbi:MAG TPA: hypothetical protein VM529_08810 [Gemmata sp.]|nr:hypothetical protein [Gemmata sp.]